MKYLTILVVLVAVTGVNFTFRDALHNPAKASRSPEKRPQLDRVSGVARPDPFSDKQPEPGKGTPDIARCAAELKREGGDNDLVLARIASECGDHLFDKARLAPDNPHLLNQAVQHYRACLAHEPTCRDAGTLFRDAKARLAHLDRLIARAAKEPSKAPRPKADPVTPPSEKTETKPAEASKPEEKIEPRTEEAPRQDESKMVGPDGVIYKRIKR